MPNYRDFRLTRKQAKAAIEREDFTDNYKATAMKAFITTFGTRGVEPLLDKKDKLYSDAWNALGALEYWAKEKGGK